MIDTHCHLTFKQYQDDLDGVLDRARAAGLRGLISISVTSDDARAALAIAESHPDVWCTAGVHPLYADKPVDWDAVREVGARPRCVAWGELGLDNHYDRPPREQQDRILAEQLAMIEAAAGDGLEMPLVLHCREAFDDLLAVLASSSVDPTRCVFHCFTGEPDDARRILDFGAWISFTGVVTFQNAPGVAEAASFVPPDRIMVETDSPFLSPEPVRTVRPNEPQHVVHIAKFIAGKRGVDPAEFERQLDANAERFFGITL